MMWQNAMAAKLIVPVAPFLLSVGIYIVERHETQYSLELGYQGGALVDNQGGALYEHLGYMPDTNILHVVTPDVVLISRSSVDTRPTATRVVGLSYKPGSQHQSENRYNTARTSGGWPGIPNSA